MQKRFRVITLIAASMASFVSTAGAGTDGKSYPGTACRASGYMGDDASFDTHGSSAYLKNTSATPKDVVCPAVQDNVLGLDGPPIDETGKITYAGLTMTWASNLAYPTCYLVATDVWDTPVSVVTSSQRSAGGSFTTHSWYNVTIPARSGISIQCTVPQGQSITLYRIDEAVD